jgi:hypothetical protein
MEKLIKLMEKKAKSQKEMMPLEKDAKVRAVQAMRKMASDEMAGPLKQLGAKKVSVMADSEEGLKEGLEKAEEIVEEGLPKKLDSEEGEEEMGEMEEECKSPEEVDAKIAELEALKAKMLAKKA